MGYTRPPHSWVVEGLVTTLSAAAGQPPLGRVNVAPMGPIVEQPEFTNLVLRPFIGSTTHANLKATEQGIFHVTDDVLLLARGAIGRIDVRSDLQFLPAAKVCGLVIASACRYHEFQVVEVDESEPRATFHCRVVHQRRLRDFIGFNRARHAVLEAAILATRLHLTGRDAVIQELERLQVLVDKTGGPAERQAMLELRGFAEAATA
jgi:hypothetical protein